MILVIGDQMHILSKLLSSGYKTAVLVSETNGLLNRLARQGLVIIIGSIDDDILMTKTTHNVEYIYTEVKLPFDFDGGIIYATEKGDFLEGQYTIQLPFVLENILKASNFFPRRKENIIDINIHPNIIIPMVSKIDLANHVILAIKEDKKGITKLFTQKISFQKLIEQITRLTDIHLRIKNDIFVGIPLNDDFKSISPGIFLDDFIDNYVQEM